MARCDRDGKSRVVVTGIGATTALGNDPEKSWGNLLAGKSGIRTITQFDASPFPTRIAAEVDFTDSMPFVGRKDLRRMSRFVQFALFACHQAITNAGIEIENEDSSEIGVIIGTGIGSLTTTRTRMRHAA